MGVPIAEVKPNATSTAANEEMVLSLSKTGAVKI
jgi:hypothetical protein